MQIQAALALSLMHLQGNSDAALTALTRALDLATQLQDQPHRLRLLGALHFFHVRTGQFSNALELAQQAQALARILAVPAAQTLADSMLGISHHLLGNHDRALTHCQAALSQPRITPFEVLGQVGYDHRIRTLVALTRTLWLRGYAEQAVALAWQTLEEADQLGHAVSLGFTLIHIASLLLWVGQTASASVVIERSLAHARGHHLQTYHAVGLGLRAALTLRDGDVTRAIALQQTCLDIMDTERYGILSAVFSGDLADGLAMLGQSSKALALIEATLASHPETFYTPELLRIKARILTRQSDRETPEIAACLMGAIEIARRQGALAWELRAATDLAALWHRSHRREQARQLLAPVYGRFTEGFETPDLLAARQLLLELDRAQS
jgi:tetratricopeptide (TPR) repeat protein